MTTLHRLSGDADTERDVEAGLGSMRVQPFTGVRRCGANAVQEHRAQRLQRVERRGVQ
ncbi:hypothetical protein JM654_15425 [Microbacterium oxydans]|nr:hypothetical protein [Microbacterium oxydans]